jgi:site-specific recombinase XerD
MGNPASKVADVRVPGPLARYAAGFRSALLAAGYTPLSAVNLMRLMVHLSRWLDARRLSVAKLTEVRVEEYLQARRSAGYTQHYTRRGLAPLLEFLATQDVRPVEQAPAGSAAQALLASFERYLLAERGLSASTISAYVARAGRFLDEYTVDGQIGAVTAADITRAVAEEAGRVSVGSVQYFVAALRAFLRFCHIEGLVAADLSAAALTVTGRRSSLLPKGIGSSEVAALLRSCDRRTATGWRDYAVLVTLLRLGLRAGELAGLGLKDIDWHAGQLVVHGKGRRHERLPLPADVGEAIIAYLLRGRPATTRREVFLTVTAPVRGLTREAVSSIVRHACDRAGLPQVGAHRLRHTAACAMVDAAVPLAEIGQVLRHRNHTTTAGYARVDLERLRTLARPWPGGEPR